MLADQRSVAVRIAVLLVAGLVAGGRAVTGFGRDADAERKQAEQGDCSNLDGHGSRLLLVG